MCSRVLARAAFVAAVCGVAAVSACTTTTARPAGATPTHPAASGSAGSRSPDAGEAATSFPRLEGVYRQGAESFVVTYQGWWLDLQSQQIRQLDPLGGDAFSYGPGWMTTTPSMGTLDFHLAPSGSVTAVTGTGPGGVTLDATRMLMRAQSVRISSTRAVLSGTLTMPPGEGPHPGIVILEGSGALDRHFESISQEIYLSLGFAVLAFDKRGVGGSTGTYPGDLATPQSIGLEAADGAAAARFLMRQRGVDPRQVGFDGNSQGGWVGPLAAENVPGLKFEILIAAPAVSSGEQDAYASFSGDSQYVPSEPTAQIDAQVRSAAGGYDPAPALARLHVPVLWVYGQLDRQVPVNLCLQALARFHNPRWTVDVLSGGSHGLILTRHGLDPELQSATRFAGRYFADIRSWVRKHITFPR